jgi:hypothetical protein
MVIAAAIISPLSLDRTRSVTERKYIIFLPVTREKIAARISIEMKISGSINDDCTTKTSCDININVPRRANSGLVTCFKMLKNTIRKTEESISANTWSTRGENPKSFVPVAARK